MNQRRHSISIVHLQEVLSTLLVLSRLQDKCIFKRVMAIDEVFISRVHRSSSERDGIRADLPFSPRLQGRHASTSGEITSNLPLRIAELTRLQNGSIAHG